VVTGPITLGHPSSRRGTGAPRPRAGRTTRLEELAQRLAYTSPMYAWPELQESTMLPPRRSGIYGWFFDTIPPGVPSDNCVRRGGRTLLYVGISPTSPSSEETLRSRIRFHFSGNAEGSTLRRTLGCLLQRRLGTVLRRVGSGTRITFASREAALSRWMARHAAVAWVELPRPGVLETHLLAMYKVPLNLEGNTHPFCSQLRVLRAKACRRANELRVLRG
jgi:hypothetical protein